MCDVTETDVLTNIDVVHTPSNTPDHTPSHTTSKPPDNVDAPPHVIDDNMDDMAQAVLLDTCTQMLLKLEAIRLSVLHLQYSLHAGNRGATAVEAVDRSNKLWRWNDGGAFSVDIVDRLQLTRPREEVVVVVDDNHIVDPVVERLKRDLLLATELLRPDFVYDVFDGGCMDIKPVVDGSIDKHTDCVDYDPIYGGIADNAESCV